MKILSIEHVAIAVDSLDKSAPFWKHVLNIPHRSKEIVVDEKVTTDIYDTGKGKVELLDSTDDDSPVGKFLSNRGPGIHHICFEVDDIYHSIAELKEKNIKIISDIPSIGAEGYKIIFIHPKSTGGVLVELAQKTNL